MARPGCVIAKASVPNLPLPIACYRQVDGNVALKLGKPCHPGGDPRQLATLVYLRATAIAVLSADCVKPPQSRCKPIKVRPKCVAVKHS